MNATQTVTDFTKVIRLGTTQPSRRWASVYCKIAYRNGCLSIAGVVGPLPSGNCLGSCGQIDTGLNPSDIKPAPDWKRPDIAKFLAVWRRWHLNDMQAGSPAQQAWLEANPTPEAGVYHYEATCDLLAEAGLNPDADGYAYGSAWNYEEVPADVLEWLRNLPDADKTPAWV